MDIMGRIRDIFEYFEDMRICLVNRREDGFGIYRCKYRGKIYSYMMRNEYRVYRYPGMEKVRGVELYRFMDGYLEWVDDVERGIERMEIGE